MVDNQPIFRVYRAQPADERTIERTHEIVRRSANVLKETPAPDTFLGRKTQEPPPTDDQ